MLEMLSKIGKDKLMHFGVSACLSSFIKTALRPLGELEASLIAFAFTIVIGIVKEVYDKVSGKGSPEWRDFVADALGAVVGVL